MAEVLGTSQTMYARYERGANALPLRHLLTLCEYYDVSADYLLDAPPTGKIPICYNYGIQKAPHFAMRCLFVCNTKNRHPLHKGAGLLLSCNILCSGQDCLTLRAVRYHGNLMADLLLDEGHIVLGLLGQVLKILDPANVAVPTL